MDMDLMGPQGALKMDRKNLIHRAADYFGIVYYGFMVLDSL
jgi:hypothetical protein